MSFVDAGSCCRRARAVLGIWLGFDAIVDYESRGDDEEEDQRMQGSGKD